MKNYMLKRQVNLYSFNFKNLFIVVFILFNFYLYFGSILVLEDFKIYFSLLFILSVFNVLINFFFKTSFFNIYFNFYMWLGNFFFFTIHTIHFDNNYNFGIGNFNFENLTHLKEFYLLLITINLSITLGTIFSNFLIKFNYSKNKYRFHKSLEKFKSYILLSIFLIIFTIYILNKNLIHFDYYFFTKDSFNPIIASFLKWFFLFGFTSILCVLINLEEKKNFIYKLFIISSIQEFLFYNSILSRGCIFNSLAILIGLAIKKSKDFQSLRIFFPFFLLILGLFIFNFYVLIHERGGSNYENLKKYRDIEIKNNQSFLLFNELKIKNLAIKVSTKKEEEAKNKQTFDMADFKLKINQVFFSFKNRIFGADSLMVIIGTEDKSLKLFKNALEEKYNPGVKSFFDQIRQGSDKSDISSNLTLPSLPGFLYYSGSKLFVFFILFLIIVSFNLLEKLNVLLNSNIILASLISQLIAYRLWHFGYAPLNSYKYFTAIILSIVLAFLFKFILLKMKIINK